MFDSKVLGNELILGPNIIIERNFGERLDIRVWRGGGLSVAKECCDYNVVVGRAQYLISANQPLVIFDSCSFLSAFVSNVLEIDEHTSWVPARIDDRRWSRIPKCFVCDFGIWYGLSRLQFPVTQLKSLDFSVHGHLRGEVGIRNLVICWGYLIFGLVELFVLWAHILETMLPARSTLDWLKITQSVSSVPSNSHISQSSTWRWIK